MEKIKCLHICNDLIGSKVHANLYRELKNKGVYQKIFYSVRPNTVNSFKSYELKSEFDIISSKPMKHYHKILFKNKIDFLYTDLKRKENIEDFDIIHSTNLFSDGAIALKIFEDYKIPYIIAIRGSDINKFFKYRPDLYPLVKKILLNAKKIIFISKSLEKNFFELSVIKNLKQDLSSKSLVIYNGIDNYWLQNANVKKNITPSNILYIGNFSKNKNVVSLIKAVLELNKEFPNIKLDIIGNGGSQEKEIISYSQNKKGIINYHGPIYDNSELKRHFENGHIFAMPSIGETFGLVYVEGLSQGLPYICSINQGVDGSFNKNVGEAVNPNSIKSISKGIKKIIKNYEKYSNKHIDLSIFNWEEISKSYINIYSDVIEGYLK